MKMPIRHWLQDNIMKRTWGKFCTLFRMAFQRARRVVPLHQISHLTLRVISTLDCLLWVAINSSIAHSYELRNRSKYPRESTIILRFLTIIIKGSQSSWMEAQNPCWRWLLARHRKHEGSSNMVSVSQSWVQTITVDATTRRRENGNCLWTVSFRNHVYRKIPS